MVHVFLVDVHFLMSQTNILLIMKISKNTFLYFTDGDRILHRRAHFHNGRRSSVSILKCHCSVWSPNQQVAEFSFLLWKGSSKTISKEVDASSLGRSAWKQPSEWCHLEPCMRYVSVVNVWSYTYNTGSALFYG